MRKTIMLALCLVFLAGIAFAETGGQSQTVYSVSIYNNTNTHVDYLIPTTTIRPGTDKLWGYDVCPIVAASDSTETWISIFDATDSVMSGECFGEQEANDYGSIHERWVRGKKIVNGVAVRVGAFSDAIVYFIRR